MDSMTLDFGHSDDYLNQNDALLDSSMDLEYILDYSGLNLDQDQDQNLTTRLARDLNVLYSTCIKSSVKLLFNQIAPLLLISILTRLIINKLNLSLFTANLLNTFLSLVYLMTYHSSLLPLVFFYSTWFLANLCIQMFALQKSSQSMRRNHSLISFICLLILNEMLMNQTIVKDSESIRGITIITQMKYLSYMLHLNESGAQIITFSFILSELISFSSYIWSINSTVFGPWINFRIHLNAMLRSFRILPKLFIKPFLKSITCALISLILSNCLFDFISNYFELTDLIELYFKALSFRLSNYFILYMSQAILLMNGMNRIDMDQKFDKAVTKKSDYESGSMLCLVKPFEIEFPRSLSYVVINWNYPIHMWLKKYIFSSTKSIFGAFGSILITYLISSILHGSNAKIAMVLISFAFLTYSEFVFRSKLSHFLSACCCSKRCDSLCTHKFKSTSPRTLLINGVFYALNIYHLLFLGHIFYQDSIEDTQKRSYFESLLNEFHLVWLKWSHLGFLSYKINLFLLASSFLIPNKD